MQSDQPDGYFAASSSGKSDAVLVLHAWWGLNTTMKTVCARLAESGLIAFAPDLYHGKVADSIAEAEKLGGALDANADQAKSEIVRGASFLMEKAGQSDRGLAVIGFSLGAYYALDLSAVHPELVHSVVLFYGTGPADFSKCRASFQGHFAENDPYEPKENVDALETSLRKAGRPVDFHRYPDTGHWFFEPDRVQAYKEEAANLSWNRAIEFLKRS